MQSLREQIQTIVNVSNLEGAKLFLKTKSLMLFLRKCSEKKYKTYEVGERADLGAK